MKKRLVTLCLGLSLLFGVGFAAENPLALTVGIYENEPLIYMDNHRVKGFFGDLFSAIAKENQWQVTYEMTSLEVSLERLKKGQNNLVLALAYSDERAKDYLFTKESIFTNWAQLYSNELGTLESFTDLIGKKIGVQKGDIHYLGPRGLKQTLAQFGIAVTYIEYDSKEEVLRALEEGDLDVGLVNRTYGALHEKAYKIYKTPIQLNPINIHIAGCKESGPYLRIIDQEIAGMKEDPSSLYYQLLDKYFEEPSEQKIPEGLYRFLAFLALAVLLLFFFTLYSRYMVSEKTKEIRTLNNELEEKVRLRTKELEQKQQELVEREKLAALGTLVAGIAHEINTPIGIAVTSTSYLEHVERKFRDQLRKGPLKASDLYHFLEDLEESTHILTTNLERAANLIESFKDIAVDQSQDEVRPIELAAYTEKIVNSLGHLLKKDKVDLIMNMDSVETSIHAGAYAQIITNLMMNSLKHAFTNQEDRKLSLHGTYFEGTSRYVITIRDNGQGIPSDLIKHVFEPFFTTKRGEGGSGLGLHIVYNLVVSGLEGSIACESEYGSYTSFTITFPVSKA